VCSRIKATRRIGSSLTILQLNIEGISKDKADYLSKLASENKVDVIVLQETHTGSEYDLRKRGDISGYTLLECLDSRVYGSATYIKDNITDFEVLHKGVENDIYTIVTRIQDVHVINVYKPPNVQWPDNCFSRIYPHPAVYLGDFNSHHNLWGYAENDENGRSLVTWMEMNHFHLVFDAKDTKSFHSARWRRDYNPDLCIVSQDSEYKPLGTTRSVLHSFPRSQHRPVILDVGIQIPLSMTIQKPRWNFQKANWNEFSQQVDRNLRWVSPSVFNYHRFVGVIKAVAKRTIPRGFRKEYIPCWSAETNTLYNEYQQHPSPASADAILNSLNAARKEKWNDLMTNMNFTHTSRSSWNLLRKLGAAKQTKNSATNINPNSIASRLLNVSNSVKLSKNKIQKMKRSLNKKRKNTRPSAELSRNFSFEELKSAIGSTKIRKAAGFDGIFPEFFKHLGPFALRWLLSFFNNILESGCIPKEFKKSKVIAILKPGKPADQASSYRPISLLSVTYKILERLLYQRIYPEIEKSLPIEQAGFRQNRNCCDQVLALTTHIEVGFQNKLKTGVAFVDLTAAYDTVWKDGLIHKLFNALPCSKIVHLIENMLSDRKFRVFIGERSSKFRTLNNGLPQGSVLSPLLFNLYTSDLPQTSSRKFIYADDLALTFQHNNFDTIENTLSNDLKIMSQYFVNWRLCPNPTKTEVSCFHLNNMQKNKELHVTLNDTLLKHNFHPTYLGVTLDNHLLYNKHIEKLKQKLKTRNNILSKLAGTSWGANARTLRLTGLALVYSTAEYCCPVWKNSCHVQKIDSQLRTTMRLITGTIKSTPTPWLPVLSNILPPDIRRKCAARIEWDKYQSDVTRFPLHLDLINLPPNRLKSRRPFWKESYLNQNFSGSEQWKLEWQNAAIHNKNLIQDPTEEVPGFDHPRKIWSQVNRLRTCHGRCNDMLHKWNADQSPLCECGRSSETIQHIVEECPRTKFLPGFTAIHKITPETLTWMSSIKPL
jgi:hypothetical protein